MPSPLLTAATLLSVSVPTLAQMVGTFTDDPAFKPGAFDLVNGRIFTPGLAIIAAPQPNTPMGGPFLHLALDISADGALPFPPPKEANNAPSHIHNITLFLTSRTTGHNLTISNNTDTTTQPPLSNILEQEPSSTVKHINWAWPACLAGNSPDRGNYNISIHQSFRLNGSDYYTIMNLPISVTNEIGRDFVSDQKAEPAPGPLGEQGARLECSELANEMRSLEELEESVRNPARRPLGGEGRSGVQVEVESAGAATAVLGVTWMAWAMVAGLSALGA